MNIDITSMPVTIDLAHVSLGAIALVFFILFLIKSMTKKSELSETRTELPESPVTPEPAAKSQPVSSLKSTSPDAALQLLALLQQEARFVDFIQENLTGFSDADVGAAARVVHEGGQKILKEYFALAPVRKEQEESRITLPEGFDATKVRLTGNVIGQAPFTGTLVHRGWNVTEVKLPKLAEGHDTHIIAPAEVEL